MKQFWFPEPDMNTYLPDGYISFFDALVRLGRARFSTEWHGEDEFRLRDYDSSGPSLQHIKNVARGAKILIAEANDPATMHLLDDDAELEKAVSQMVNEARQPDIDAKQRYADLALELRKSLLDHHVIAIGLGDDGSQVELTSQYWRSNLALAVLYSGICAVDEKVFVSPKLRNSPQRRFVMFDNESVDALILMRSSRVEPKKGEDFELARQWLFQQMRRSPTKRPKPKDVFRVEFNKANKTTISVRRWAGVWALCIEDADAPSWSKAGPTKER